MKYFMEVLVLAACAVPFIQAGKSRLPTENNECVIFTNGTDFENKLIGYTFLEVPDNLTYFRVIVKDPPPISMIKVVASKIEACDKVLPVVELSTDDKSYLVFRDPNQSEDGYYQLTLYYDWA